MKKGEKLGCFARGGSSIALFFNCSVSLIEEVKTWAQVWTSRWTLAMAWQSGEMGLMKGLSKRLRSFNNMLQD